MKKWYDVTQHGLLWIVWFNESDYMGDHFVKDSEWEDEEKARAHCALLNNKLYI
jgi:hypothetical protein